MWPCDQKEAVAVDSQRTRATASGQHRTTIDTGLTGSGGTVGYSSKDNRWRMGTWRTRRRCKGEEEEEEEEREWKIKTFKIKCNRNASCLIFASCS